MEFEPLPTGISRPDGISDESWRASRAEISRLKSGGEVIRHARGTDQIGTPESNTSQPEVQKEVVITSELLCDPKNT